MSVAHRARVNRREVVRAPSSIARAGHYTERVGIAPISLTHAHIVSGAAGADRQPPQISGGVGLCSGPLASERRAETTERPSVIRTAPRLHHVRGHIVRRQDVVFWRRPRWRGHVGLGSVRLVGTAKQSIPRHIRTQRNAALGTCSRPARCGAVTLLLRGFRGAQAGIKICVKPCVHLSLIRGRSSSHPARRSHFKPNARQRQYLSSRGKPRRCSREILRGFPTTGAG